jgi:hypothetical protein
MLPLFRQHHIRWAQVARRGPRQADGITVRWSCLGVVALMCRAARLAE